MYTLPVVARQRLGSRGNEYTKQKIVGPVVFYAVRVISNECLWVCLWCTPLLLLGNNLFNALPR
jgi:hypothetical protein